MSEPTPEGLALVEQVRAMNVRMHGDAHSFQGEWAEYTLHLSKEEAARRIDAHVAERMAPLKARNKKLKEQLYGALYSFESPFERELKTELAALRAAADAMAEALGRYLEEVGVTRDYFDLVDTLAAYRALSPAGEGK